MLHILLQVSAIVAVATANLGTTIELNDGTHIPVVAYGTFGRVQEVHLMKAAIMHAIESGYRHIDTAAVYLNEEQIGEGIAEMINRGVVTREDLWITTKLDPALNRTEDVLPGLLGSLQRLKLDYVDLYLIHRPNPSDECYLDVWKGMEEVKKLNLTRSIGVSNFNEDQLDRVIASSDTVPAVNQIEIHPFSNDLKLVEYNQNLNIAVMSYANFAFMVPRPWYNEVPYQTFEEPIFRQLAQKHKKLPSQIVLRYLIDLGTIVIPRSTNFKHMEINIDVFDFKLTEDEIASINGLRQEGKVYEFDPALMPRFNEYYGLK